MSKAGAVVKLFQAVGRKILPNVFKEAAPDVAQAAVKKVVLKDATGKWLVNKLTDESYTKLKSAATKAAANTIPNVPKKRQWVMPALISVGGTLATSVVADKAMTVLGMPSNETNIKKSEQVIAGQAKLEQQIAELNKANGVQTADTSSSQEAQAQQAFDNAFTKAGITDDTTKQQIMTLLSRPNNTAEEKANSQAEVQKMIASGKFTAAQINTFVAELNANKTETTATTQQPASKTSGGGTTAQPATTTAQPTATKPASTTASTAKPAATTAAEEKPGITQAKAIIQQAEEKKLDGITAVKSLMALVDSKAITEADFNSLLQSQGVTYADVKAKFAQAEQANKTSATSAKPAVTTPATPQPVATNPASTTQSNSSQPATTPSTTSAATQETTTPETQTTETKTASAPAKTTATKATEESTADTNKSTEKDTSTDAKVKDTLAKADKTAIGVSMANYASNPGQLQPMLQTMSRTFSEAKQQGKVQQQRSSDGKTLTYYVPTGDKTGVVAVESFANISGQWVSSVSFATAAQKGKDDLALGKTVSYTTVNKQVEALPNSYQNQSADSTDDLTSVNQQVLQNRFGAALQASQNMTNIVASTTGQTNASDNQTSSD